MLIGFVEGLKTAFTQGFVKFQPSGQVHKNSSHTLSAFPGVLRIVQMSIMQGDAKMFYTAGKGCL